jgi:hypothetical protein
VEVNQLPSYDQTDNPTGCCPRFQPQPWDDQLLKFENKPFVRASTVSLFHVPLNMGKVFQKTFEAIRQAHAEGGGFAVLSRDDSPWHGEHLFAVERDVPGADMVHLTGTYVTKIFDGPFSEARTWCDELRSFAQAKGKQPGDLYFFYTTCPRCAKTYGHNYVVGIAQVS